ncbi:MAG: hypothetical protein HN726_03700 [Candidatus Magasanikbacteria bacterium]|jgi:hypothetical protein|nr:hypothetical protein [Candidatus Magasanikbacteria bacterium]MBT4221483.1 hypothetical protein [Candidatus Magasanikbacteria bacterium]MBT4350669.1 hypothetical protein [Candidatus Magasanikbacteria bacterium]MBT4541655.1 hypothetical protein [Candidatus Magasanikbacteria bacterium]MBT6252902.1 hypothetical protein [Candidatus Magasanikbacteria bacterium]
MTQLMQVITGNTASYLTVLASLLLMGGVANATSLQEQMDTETERIFAAHEAKEGAQTQEEKRQKKAELEQICREGIPKFETAFKDPKASNATKAHAAFNAGVCHKIVKEPCDSIDWFQKVNEVPLKGNKGDKDDIKSFQSTATNQLGKLTCKTYILFVKAKKDGPEKGAEVSMDGTRIKATDEEGKVDLGVPTIGEHSIVVMTKDKRRGQKTFTVTAGKTNQVTEVEVTLDDRKKVPVTLHAPPESTVKIFNEDTFDMLIEGTAKQGVFKTALPAGRYLYTLKAVRGGEEVEGILVVDPDNMPEAIEIGFGENPEPSTWTKRDTLGTSLAGLGIVGLIIGSYGTSEWVSGQKDIDGLEKEFQAGLPVKKTNLDEALKRTNTGQGLTLTGFIIGGGLTAAGAFFFFTEESDEQDTDGQITVLPIIDKDIAGIGVSGQF